MRKIINSENVQYQPVLTEELVLDDRPISGSFNSITSDAVYKAISVDPGNVPPVESTDDGKVLTASYGEGGGSFEWAAAPSELPDTTGASQGDVLSIGSSGLEWATPSGGGGSVSMTPVLKSESITINTGVGQGTIQTWVTPSGSSFSGTLSKDDVLFLDLRIGVDNGSALTSSDTFSATVYGYYVDPLVSEVSYAPLASIAASPFINGEFDSKYGRVRVPLYMDRNLSVSSDSITRAWTLKVDLTVPDTVSSSCIAYLNKI